MNTARDLMTPDPVYCQPGTSVAEAARLMAANDIGSVPVCDTEGRLLAVVTDRDLVLGVLAQGRDGQTMVSALVKGGAVVTVACDDSVDVVVSAMKANAVRRIPVLDGVELVGMISQADVARAMPDARIGDLVGAISSAPPND